jgi:AcrR family transcriptional regulator
VKKPTVAKQKRTRRRIGRPPGQSSAATRKRILHAARGCFARLGFERATNRDIAAAAGCTAAAIYRHFDSKPDLYVEAVSDAVAEIVPRLREAAAAQSSTRAALRAILQSVTSVTDTLGDALHFLAAVPIEIQRNPAIAQRIFAQPGEVYAIVTEMVEAGVRSGEFTRARAQRVISVTIAMLIGVGAYRSSLGPALGDEAAAGFVDLLDSALFSS